MPFANVRTVPAIRLLWCWPNQCRARQVNYCETREAAQISAQQARDSQIASYVTKLLYPSMMSLLCVCARVLLQSCSLSRGTRESVSECVQTFRDPHFCVTRLVPFRVTLPPKVCLRATLLYLSMMPHFSSPAGVVDGTS